MPFGGKLDVIKMYHVVNLLEMVVQVDLVCVLLAAAVAHVLLQTFVYNLHVTHSVSKLQKNYRCKSDEKGLETVSRTYKFREREIITKTKEASKDDPIKMTENYPVR